MTDTGPDAASEAPDPRTRSSEDLIAHMTLDEKAAMTAGRDVWSVAGVPRLGIPALKMTDGPNGARGSAIFGGAVRALCVPCGSALGATFDPELIARVGAALGVEARQKRSRVLLAPTINLPRSPLYGRSFECYSEDPRLAGSIAAAFVSGVQSEGVATTAKHLIGNETEFQRQTINSVIDERTLREVYLLPFEWAVRRGGSLGIMTSYNRLNGKWCSLDGDLLNGILRDEWGFEGFVVSDWFAAGETVASLEAGQDIQMPGPDRYFGAPVAAAISNGEVEEALLDELVKRRLHLHSRLDAWDDDAGLPEEGLETEAGRAIAYRAAVDSTVLLKNDGLLPLLSDVSVALIGPNVEVAHIMGGGSAQLAAHRRTPLASVMRERLGDRLRVERGCVIDKIAPAMQPTDGFAVEFFASDDWSGPVVGETTMSAGRAIWVGEPAEGLGTDPFTARMTGTLSPTETGTHTMTLIQAGRARVLIDGDLVLDGITEPLPPGEAFFGFGSIEISAEVDLTAGESVEVVVEFVAGGGTGLRGVAVGHAPPVPDDLFDRAAAAARACDVAVVMVGTSSEWETEGTDREVIDLPGDQNLLIETVVAANPRTVVVVNAGAPVTMPWVDDVPAIVLPWLGGQEMSPALDAVLFGDAEPGGRLPITFPIAIEHTPAFGNFPGENNETRYAEGLLVGWRWYDTRNLPVLFPFGHGLSYAELSWGEPAIATHEDGSIDITINVTNTSERDGAECVQVYAEAPAGAFTQPRRKLVGWKKLAVPAGSEQPAVVTIKPRDLAHWQPAGGELEALLEQIGVSFSSPGVDPKSDSHDAQGWYVAEGPWTFHVARSSQDTVVEFTRELAGRGPLSGHHNEL